MIENALKLTPYSVLRRHGLSPPVVLINPFSQLGKSGRKVRGRLQSLKKERAASSTKLRPHVGNATARDIALSDQSFIFSSLMVGRLNWLVEQG